MILDLNLPGLDGLDVARELRRTSQVPIIMATARVEESDRLVRASRVFGRALELFEGDDEQTRRWLTTPATALGGRTPFDLARSEVGGKEVETLIGRLEHGIPA